MTKLLALLACLASTCAVAQYYPEPYDPMPRDWRLPESPYYGHYGLNRWHRYGIPPMPTYPREWTRPQRRFPLPPRPYPGYYE